MKESTKYYKERYLKQKHNSVFIFTFVDQFLISAVRFDKHIATRVFVTEPKPTSSFISMHSNVKIN